MHRVYIYIERERERDMYVCISLSLSLYIYVLFIDLFRERERERERDVGLLYLLVCSAMTSDKGLSGLSQNDNFLKHSRRRQTQTKLGISGWATHLNFSPMILKYRQCAFQESTRGIWGLSFARGHSSLRGKHRFGPNAGIPRVLLCWMGIRFEQLAFRMQ